MKINQDGADGFTLDIQVYSNYGKNHWGQERYLVHGIEDVLWTSSMDDVISYLKEELVRLEILAPSKVKE